MYECDTCTRTFATYRACVQHMNDTDHREESTHECDRCTKTFRNQAACDQHMRDANHHRFECQTCTLTFPSQADTDAHMNTRAHWRHYCSECERSFSNENSLRMHLNSRIHRGTSVACPFYKRSFVTASGVAHHLETGSCSAQPGINRETIYTAIHERDPCGVITHKQLEWHAEERYVDDWVVENAWNGHAYWCYLCDREFSKSMSLEQHLKSPTHKQKIYHCPGRDCDCEFVSLAALFSHLESESCGFIKFERGQQKVAGLLAGRRRLIGFD